MSPDSAHVEIRSLHADDLDEIIAIAEILEEAPHWPRARYEELLPAGDLLPDQSSRPRIALVARDARSGEILGFIVANLAGPEAELESIAVAAHARRRGVGRLLLASLVTRLRTEGIADLHLEVRASNFGATRFYQAQDFKQTGVRPRYYADPEEDAVLMTLRLA
jgi:[ribosomal protein S18]-alanine N-acetyltransferase